MKEVGIFFGIVAVVTAGICILIYYLRSPYKYPQDTIVFDVSGKRLPQIENLIDNSLNKDGIEVFYQHHEYVENWKKECLHEIEKSLFKKRRKKQFEKCLDDEHEFALKMVRYQTRYRQVNYCKIPYDVEIEEGTFYTSYDRIVARYEYLQKIGGTCTAAEYVSKNQRKLMTKELREMIAKRDNYTCRICGKYMPDEVGLHIDHIIPISKGGKSVPSNLQVLCSKCNGKKSSK